MPAGTQFVQLRIKDQPDAELRRQVREAQAVCTRHGADLIVNDYWQIAIDERCSLVHLGQEDLVDADVKAIRRRGPASSASARTIMPSWRRASPSIRITWRSGPVWPTALKKMPWAPQGLDRLGEWKKLIGNRPLVAIGGLTLERALLCLKAGADSAAVVGDIVNNPDPVAQAKAWIAATRVAA